MEELEHSRSSAGTGEVIESKEEVDGPTSKHPLARAMLHVKWASFLQRAGQHARAIEHFDSSLAICPSARAHFGRGTCLATLRRPQEAVDALREALHLRPSMVSALVNLAGVLLGLRQFEESEQLCRQALLLEPASREAVMNLANVLRCLGRRSDAVSLVWEHILAESLSDREAEASSILNEPTSKVRLSCRNWCPICGEHALPLLVVCVKWGKRYSAVYVNRLHSALRRQALLRNVPFLCFTDDQTGLDEGIDIRQLPCGLPLWWGKAFLFSQQAGLDGHRVLYLDLDQVIVGNLQNLAAYSGPFAVLATDGIACELADGGYNSSVMAWEASPHFRPVYEQLTKAALKYVHRFDHWLEMMIDDADTWQTVAPGCIVDFTTCFRGGNCLGFNEEDALTSCSSSFVAPLGELVEVGQHIERSIQQREQLPPSGSIIVTFPRSPKPHEVINHHAWIKRHWLGEGA